MSMNKLVCSSILVLSSALATPAADLSVLPADVSLAGPNARQRLSLLTADGGRYVGDITGRAAFSSSNPAVAAVDAAGIVRAVGDGEAVITARSADKEASAKVRVTRTREPSAPSFRNHVLPLMTKIGCNSGACHGALAGKGGMKLSLRGYNPAADHFVLTRQVLGRRVDPIEPSRSLALLKPTLTVPHGGGQKLEVGSVDYQVLADWIASGAAGPRADDPRLQRVEVFPPAIFVQPKDTLQVLVRAWYSDGHAEDVTRWAKYNSTEDTVATVDADGRVRAAGYGEAAITVWYANRVATCRVVAPLPGALDPKVFAAAERRNFIDELVLLKLQELRIPPSPLCTDEEFIRRVYLDAAGILPTPEELHHFLADPAPDRRARLIDALLERPEFVDYWAYKWSDLLLLSTRKLSQPSMWAFYQFIRQSVADNKPWDRFAREIVTASGSTLRQGAASYFVLHKDVSELTEATAVTFLGMSVTCCRCHNHPLEKWTQDQYWGLANLFSRVAIKEGERTGELTVQSTPQGNAPHPRRGVPMPPTPLDGKPLPLDSPQDRRQYFADWLTAPDNPYFARALVNRVWRNFLGRGLVEAEDDLRQTNPPTNAELLDALAKDFTAHAYDVKRLIRTVLNSATYQRSSRPLAGNVADDRFYSHYLVRRLSAEVILDTYATVTGVPGDFAIYFDEKPVFQFPKGTRAQQLPDVKVLSPFLDSFGRPERMQTCSCERQQDSSVSQALHLNNGRTLNEKLRAKDARVAGLVAEKVGDADAVRRLFLLALCRGPTEAELRKFTDLMALAAKERASRQEVLEDLFWSVLTSREYLFNR
jgi:hypothetical protein